MMRALQLSAVVSRASAVAFTVIPLISAAATPPDTFPARPLRIIVPQSAGGSTDLAARIVTQRLSDALGQAVVVDNRPGAGSLNG